MDCSSSSPLLASVALSGLDWLPLAMISKSRVMPGAYGPWGSHSNSEVKQHWAKTLHRWETVRELMELLAWVQITTLHSDHCQMPSPRWKFVVLASVSNRMSRSNTVWNKNVGVVWLTIQNDIYGGPHSTMDSVLALNSVARVWFSAFPRIFLSSRIFLLMLLRFPALLRTVDRFLIMSIEPIQYWLVAS